MENRKFVKRLIPIILLGFFICGVTPVFAYGPGTHSLLTREAADFYNINFPQNKINAELINYLIDGSRREDDVPRFMNHFYDPIYNRGITFDSAIDPFLPIGQWQKSKDWVNDSANQNNLVYKIPATIASVLTSIEQKKISAISSETDFTWQKAIGLYASGRKEEAIFALGHVLHLLEDASVPDHTRNDAHLGDSPYELFSDRFNLSSPDQFLIGRLRNKKPTLNGNLNGYFDGLANYSNNNFYSKDTIGIQSGYNLPAPDYSLREGGYTYGFKSDPSDGDYKLFIKKRDSILSTVVSDTGNIVLFLEKSGGDKVLSDYWSRLSTKSVQYSAGIINLFFDEVNRNIQEGNISQLPKKSFFGQAIDSTKAFLSSFGSAIRGAISVMFGRPEEEVVVEIPLNKDTGNSQNLSAENKSDPIPKLQKPIFSIDKNEIFSGDSIRIKGEKFPFRASVNIRFTGPAVLSGKTVLSGDAGTFETSYVFPKEIAVGTYYLYANYSNFETDRIKILISNKPENKQEEIKAKEEAGKKKPVDKDNESIASTGRICFFNATGSVARQPVIINEVAWMGSTRSSSDEWIELKNTSGAEADISGWQILDAEEKMKIKLPNNSRMAAGGFFLLERTDEDSALGVVADLIYSGALSNSDEGLRLFDRDCRLIDEVMADSDWPAGDTSSRRTMERDNAGFGWHTSSFVDGTPKQENSNGFVQSNTGGGSSGGGG
jgi:hypothetical protein